MGVAHLTSDPGVSSHCYMSVIIIMTALLMLLLVTPGLGFHLPGEGRLTGTPDTCQASDNQPGQCIEITKCESLENILENQITKEKLKFLSKFSCGFTNNIPKICCPLKQNDIQGRGSNPRVEKISTTPTTPTTTTRTTTVVPSTTTTRRFRHVEETTKPNNIHRRNRGNENDLRIGFGGWTGIKCSSEFCREPK